MAAPPRRFLAGLLRWGAALAALAPLALVAAFLYFSAGVDLVFVAGFARSLVQPPRGVTAPTGVQVDEWAAGLSSPTSIAFDPAGRLYVAQLSGEIVALDDTDGDGLADLRLTFAAGLASPLGLAYHDGALYVGRRGGVDRVRDLGGDGLADEIHTLIAGLPAGRHQTNGLAFGPDGRLYVATGSRSDRGETPIGPLEAGILVADADGTGLRVYASGLRNPYDLAFHPEAEALFASDNGRDVPARGVPDELNHIVEAGGYGWPGCWGQGGVACEGALGPVVELEQRSSADGLAFYTGAMFPQWQNDLFVALYGSLSNDPSIGRVVQRIELTQAGGVWSGTVHDFAGGFDRPLDVAVAPDGALFVADFGRGIIYRLLAP